MSVISAVVRRLKTEFKKIHEKKRKKERKKERKPKHWLIKQKQKLKRQKVTSIRKKNKRNVQKKITDTAKGFGGEKRKKEKKPTAPGVPRRSPIQVLTGPDVA